MSAVRNAVHPAVPTRPGPVSVRVPTRAQMLVEGATVFVDPEFAGAFSGHAIGHLFRYNGRWAWRSTTGAQALADDRAAALRGLVGHVYRQAVTW